MKEKSIRPASAIDMQVHIVGARYYNPSVLDSFAGGGVTDKACARNVQDVTQRKFHYVQIAPRKD